MLQLNLMYLDKNDTAYNEYHQWREKYRVEENPFLCTVCKGLWELKRESKLKEIIVDYVGEVLHPQEPKVTVEDVVRTDVS